MRSQCQPWRWSLQTLSLRSKKIISKARKQWDGSHKKRVKMHRRLLRLIKRSMEVYHRRKSYILHFPLPLSVKCPQTESLTYYLWKEMIISKDLIDFSSQAHALYFLYGTRDDFRVFFYGKKSESAYLTIYLFPVPSKFYNHKWK